MRLLSAVRRLRGLAKDTRGISMIEFGLMAPIFLGTIFAGLEMSQYIIANQRMQRITANVADLVAQSGTASIGATEAQINDILDSLNYSAQPFDLLGRGRIIITAVQGQKNASNVVENRKLWHRCNGSLTGQPNRLPGAIGSIVTLPRNRQLLDGEILIHAQLEYWYEPLAGVSIAEMWSPQNRYISRTAEYRPRSKTFISITPVAGQTAKDNCPTT